MMQWVFIGALTTLAAVQIYWAWTPSSYRLLFLIVGSLSVLFWINPLLGGAILFLSLLLCAAAARAEFCRRFSALIILGLVAVLVGLKLTAFDTFAVFGRTAPEFLFPLGASFFCFRSIHLILQSARSELRASFRESFLYLVFFPVFLAGPFTRIESFYAQRKSSPAAGDFWLGLQRITLGLFKKCFVLGVLFHFSVDRWAESLLSRGGARAFELGLLASLAFVKAYFDLSAYTDLAVGVSRLLGFTVNENFWKPFWQPNLAAFWRSWHCSLGQWCRDHVYFPLLGLTRKPWVAVCATMAVMGLWHQLSVKWSVWAAYHAVGLLSYAAWTRFKKRIAVPTLPAWFARPLSCLMTFVYVALGYLLVSASSFQQFTRLVR